MEAKIKVDIYIKLDQVKEALKKRGIAINEANVKRYLKIMANGSFSASDDMYNKQTMDRETLLMYGFTFEKRN